MANKEKCWWLVDNKDGDLFANIIGAKTKDEAIEAAQDEWNKLTRNDKSRRVMFGVMYGSSRLDGGVDFDTVTDSYMIVDKEW